MSLADLLQAVAREEVDVAGLMLAPLLRDALAESPDLETRAENVWRAAQLIHLKALRMLPPLPCPPEPDLVEEDPARRPNLAPAQLRQATEFLRERLGAASVLNGPETPDPDPLMPEGLSLLDVLRLARQAVVAAQAHQDLAVQAAAIRIEDMIRLLESALARAGQSVVCFDDLLDAQPSLDQRISLFLAVLELVKAARVRIEQPDAFASIALYPHSA